MLDILGYQKYIRKCFLKIHRIYWFDLCSRVRVTGRGEPPLTDEGE